MLNLGNGHVMTNAHAAEMLKAISGKTLYDAAAARRRSSCRFFLLERLREFLCQDVYEKALRESPVSEFWAALVQKRS